ncbi:MAG: glycosyltransferase family 9 protein [Planctomycetota bacterium]
MNRLRTLARALRTATNRALALAARAASRRAVEPPRVVLVHRVGRLGDGAAAWPALVALRRRYPDARLVLLTSTGEDEAAGMAEWLERSAKNERLVDEVRRYRPSAVARDARAFLRELRALSIDRWQALPQAGTTPWTELRNLAFARAAGARQLSGFAVGGLRWLGPLGGSAWDRRLAPDLPEYRRLLALIGADDDGARLAIEPDARAVGALVLAPGAARSANRWPLERFRAVAARELECGGRVVVVGGAGERELAATLLTELGGGVAPARALDLAGRTDALGTLAVLAAARAVLTNDSGVAHLAGLVGAPTLVVSSARDVAGRWAARGAVVLRENPSCGPCWRDDCHLDHRCLNDITTERVLLALDAIAPLRRGSPPSTVDKRLSLGSPSRP